jgi:hypothetical protein
MKHLSLTLLILFGGVVVSGCAAHVGVGGLASLPSDSASNCAAQCKTIGLPLESVVIMANQVGCVCRTTSGAPGSAAPNAGKEPTSQGASAAGMAAILVLQDQQQTQRR